MGLIDPVELAEELSKRVWYEREDEKQAVRIVKEFPTVDAVPVVRCKDCRYGSCTGEYGLYYECELSEGEVAPLWREDDFCSYGERRKDGADEQCLISN